ncbi:MAG: DUF3392 family protein [Glaciecola sp.]
MDLVYTTLNSITNIIQPYLNEVALTLLATLLVVYGDILNRHIKKLVRPYHFVLRTAVFIFVCAFGYGLLIVFLTPFVKSTLMQVPPLYRGSAIIGIFCMLGWMAENRRYI